MAEKRPLSDRIKRLAEVSATFTDEELQKRFGGTIVFPGPDSSNEVTEMRARIRAARALKKTSRAQIKKAGLTGDEGF